MILVSFTIMYCKTIYISVSVTYQNGYSETTTASQKVEIKTSVTGSTGV